jgi:hypothetical protein
VIGALVFIRKGKNKQKKKPHTNCYSKGVLRLRNPTKQRVGFLKYKIDKPPDGPIRKSRERGPK